MRRIVTLFTSLLYSFRALIFSGPPGIRILMYHKVEPRRPEGQYDQLNVPSERFEEQMMMLSKEYRVIPLKEAVSLLKSGIDDAFGKPKIVITFDDGYLDNLTHALPILEKYNLPATIFVTTQFCDQTLQHPRYAKTGTIEHLNWDQVKELHQHPLITIGSHTLTHPLLSEINDELSNNEIMHSKAIIEEYIGSRIDFFCYPSGNYSDRELATLNGSNYVAAVTVKPGTNSIETPRLELHRTEITEKDSPFEMKKKLSGCYDWLHTLLDVKREKRFKKRRAEIQKRERAASKQATKLIKQNNSLDAASS